MSYPTSEIRLSDSHPNQTTHLPYLNTYNNNKTKKKTKKTTKNTKPKTKNKT